MQWKFQLLLNFLMDSVVILLLVSMKTRWTCLEIGQQKAFLALPGQTPVERWEFTLQKINASFSYQAKHKQLTQKTFPPLRVKGEHWWSRLEASLRNSTWEDIRNYVNYTWCGIQRFSFDLEMKTREQLETKNERRWSDLIGLSNGYKRAWLLVG